MTGLGDLFGSNGVVEQLLLWGLVNQLITSEFSPLFTAQVQAVNSDHPLLALPPDMAAELVSRGLLSHPNGVKEAARGGIDTGRFDSMVERARPRLAPADLAEAVLRSYLSAAEANAQAAPQGYTPAMMAILADLAGDAPGADQLAMALRRGIIARDGHGAASISFAQGIAETRLHNKWGPVIAQLARVLLSPEQAAEASARGFLSPARAEVIAGQSGLAAADYAVLRELIQPRLSPPDAASAVIRNFLPTAEAEAIAAKQGIDAATFTTMTHLAGDAPGPQQLAEALRRGAIKLAGKGPSSTSFEQGIAEGRLADKWSPVIRDLAKLWPTPVDALDAALKGQIPPQEGRRLYELLGGDLRFYDWLLSSQGEGPTPLEATVMANRGFISWDGIGPGVTSFEQAVRESRYRDKWAPAYKRFAEYLPAEGTAVTLLSHGVIDAAKASEIFAAHGMNAEQIAEFIDEAHTEALSDYRGLTISTALAAYHDRLIDAADATVILEALHVTPGAAQLLLAYSDFARDMQAVNNAVTRVRTLFAARKITADTAQQSLTRLGVPASQIPDMIAAWEVENSVTVKVLTETQIIDAWELGVLTQDEASAELGNIGYTPFDAWVLMSTKVKGQLPGRPAQGPPPPQAQVIPGTT